MYKIEIANTQDHLPIDEALLKEVAGKTFEKERVAAASVSIALVDNDAIRELNKRYLDHDDVTDVLSFLLECESGTSPSQQSQEGEGPSLRGAGKRIEGEVVISAETAVQRAKEFRWTPQEELVLYLVHGLLHLVGYDDRSPMERRLMRQRERSIMLVVSCQLAVVR